jgi:hypothetical protein
MRFIYGFIFAVVLLTCGAAIHDNIEAGSGKPLVNWNNVGDLVHTTFESVMDQINRWIK